MIGTVTEALIATIHEATPDRGTWVQEHSLAADDGPLPPDSGIVALVGIAPDEGSRAFSPGFSASRSPATTSTLRLTYLVTYAGPPADTAARLEDIVLALEASPVLTAAGNARLTLLAPTAQELHDIWASTGLSRRASLLYEVRPVTLASA
ncbi:Pvc16 family protein [Demequina iriomotensis]|uniref:Pvc16 family protein n=1 Tax=Demequina iriomotensis TaxID=1536641 RepID=UPI0007828456|nr:Pvc16 family protein [Demequina iriomotensis]